jgi:hypothetical protein
MSSQHHPQLIDRAHVVYGFYDHDGTLLYVGCTVNLEQRLNAHQSTLWFWPSVARVEVLGTAPTFAAGIALEARLIRDLTPRWNRAGRKPRRQWSEGDYLVALLGWLVGSPIHVAPRHLGKHARIWVAEANAKFGLDLSMDPHTLLTQVARGERIVAFGRIIHDQAPVPVAA